MNDATAVWHGDRLYVGGWVSQILFTAADSARLYVYTPTTDMWDTPIDTPVYWFGLTTYHSQLVLVGGKECIGEGYLEEYTTKLWTLSERGQWQKTLPPMRTNRHSACAVSYRDHLLVAGGMVQGTQSSNVVEVYNGSHWMFAQPLPVSYYDLKSAILGQYWFLMGGKYSPFKQKQLNTVHYVSLDSLLASCPPFETSQASSAVWKRLTDAPYPHSSTAVFDGRLVAVGGGEVVASLSSTVYAYSFHANSWIHIGDMPFAASETCSVVLPTGELMVVGGHYSGRVSTRNVLKATIKVTPYDPDSQFTTSALSRLEGVGIPVITSLNNKAYFLKQILSGLIPHLSASDDATSILNAWSSSCVLHHLPSTWKNLLLIIRLLKVDELAQRMETYLREEVDQYEQYSDSGVSEVERESKVKIEDADQQLRLRDEVIYKLKQDISSLKEESDSTVLMFKERIALLTAENERLKSQQLVKKETDSATEEKPFLPEIKTEPKEEATGTVTTPQPETTWNLRGVEVCGEMTVVVYSSHYQQITWPGFGLRLNVPKGCLPAGMEQCTINIKASLAGQYEFSENSNLISTIYWLRCDEVCEFARPITVEIQHCAKSENRNNLNLSFVRAVCSQKQLPYTFKQLPGGNFTSHSSYGVIELKRFSGVGVTQEGSEDREYCSQLFYLGQPDRCKIHYVVTWNIDAHLTVVKEEYIKEGAIRDLYQSIEFESDAITLDIPLEGVNIKGWKITPLMRPVVTKKQVDNFREGKLTPCCQLLAKISGRKKKIPSLEHQVKLKGAKYPNDVFVINLPAGDNNLQETFGDLPGPPPMKKSRSEGDATAFSRPSSTQNLSKTISANNVHVLSSAGPSSAAIHATTALDTRLNHSNHFKVTHYLQNLDEDHICTVRGALGLSYSKLCKMTKYPDDMVAAWLRREDFVMSMSGEPTWRTLVEALRKVGQEGTARDIEEAESRI